MLCQRDIHIFQQLIIAIHDIAGCLASYHGVVGLQECFFEMSIKCKMVILGLADTGFALSPSIYLRFGGSYLKVKG